MPNIQWLSLALVAPLFWAFANNVDASLRRHFIKSDIAITWFMALSRLPVAILCMAIGGFEWPNFAAAFFMLIGGLLWMFPFWMYFKTIHQEEASRVALMLQVMPVFIMLIAFVLLKERLNLTQGVAFSLLLCGGVLAVTKRLEGRWHFNGKALLWMLGADFIWALADVLFKKYAVDFSNFYSAFGIYAFGAFWFSLIPLMYSAGRSQTIRHLKGLSGRSWVLLVVNQMASILGSLAFAYALTLGYASLTAVFIGVQPLFVIGLSWLLSAFIPEIHREKLAGYEWILKGLALVVVIGGLMMLSV